MNVEKWLVKMVPTLCPSLMVAGLWSLYLPLATSPVALNRANSICQYDVTYFDSPVYVWALRLFCLPKLMDVRFKLTCAAPQFSPETNHLKYWARLACLQLLACEFWLSTYLLSSPNDGWRKVEAHDEFLMDQSQDKFSWQTWAPPAEISCQGKLCVLWPCVVCSDWILLMPFHLLFGSAWFESCVLDYFFLQAPKMGNSCNLTIFQMISSLSHFSNNICCTTSCGM